VMLRLAALLPFLLAWQDPEEPPARLKWRLAKHDFARCKAQRVVTDDKGVEKLEAHPNRLVGLFGYEIGDDVRYAPPALDWWEVPLIIGFTLPSKPLKMGPPQEWALELTDGWGYAPVLVRGTAARRKSESVDGASCVVYDLKAQIAPHPKTRPTGNQRAIEKGTYEATVHFDAAAGVVRRLRFAFAITFVGVDAKKTPEAFKQAEQIDLVAVLPPRHKEFEREVNAAIDKGIEWLWRQWNDAEGHWGAHYEYTVGPTALALLTILKGSVDRKDARIRRGLDWLVAQPFKRTYETGISIMALEAWYSPKDPNERFKPGEVADADIDKHIEAAHRTWVKEAARFLESNITTGMWSYPSTDSNARDFSNTQYGVLGLFSAARCGAVLDAGSYHRVLSTYLRVQQKQGPRVELGLVDADAKGKTSAKQLAEARGWMYHDNLEEAPYASMTAGGLSSVIIADSILRRMGAVKYDRADQAQAKAAIRDGWAWLQHHWSVKGNSPHGRDWYYYTLYGLERCGMLSGVASVGDHDWYYEGAQMLISNQAADGAWVYGQYCWFHDICFAVLFLKRATVRVASGK